MKSLRSVLTAASLAAALSISAFAADSDPGYVDLGKLIPAAKGEFVEVNLSAGMLKFASKLAAREEPEAAALIAGLKHVRVNVVSLDDTNRQGMIDHIESIRRKLSEQGWTQMVTVRERGERNNVDVHVKQRGDDAIDGLVITVIDEKGEAVLVNIVGNISADQIAKVADNLDIEPLRHVRVKMKHKGGKDKDSDDEV
jgi:Skp family chaperone for outer membrane proteins